jgi:hypothetical protein
VADSLDEAKAAFRRSWEGGLGVGPLPEKPFSQAPDEADRRHIVWWGKMREIGGKRCRPRPQETGVT